MPKEHNCLCERRAQARFVFFISCRINSFSPRKIPKKARTHKDKSEREDRKGGGKDAVDASSKVQKKTVTVPRTRKTKTYTAEQVQKKIEADRRAEERKRKLARTIRGLCENKTLLSPAQVLRLCRQVTRNTIGDGVRLQAKAMMAIHNSLEAMVIAVLRAGIEYIPPTQQTLRASHIRMALERPHIKEAFRVVDGRMTLSQRPAPRKKKVVEAH